MTKNACAIRKCSPLAVRKRIELIGDEELQKKLPQWQGIVEITLKDGRTVRHHTEAARGTADSPMTRTEVDEKCHHLMVPVLGAKITRAERCGVGAGEPQRCPRIAALAPVLNLQHSFRAKTQKPVRYSPHMEPSLSRTAFRWPRLRAALVSLVFMAIQHTGALALEVVLQAPINDVLNNKNVQSGNGRYLALWETKYAQVIDLATGRIVSEIGGFNYLKSAALSWEGDRVAIAADDRIREYEVITRKLVRELSFPACPKYPVRAFELNALAYARSGALLAVKGTCAAAWLPGSTTVRVADNPDLGVITFSIQPLGDTARFIALVQPQYAGTATKGTANRAVAVIDLEAQTLGITRIVSAFAGQSVKKVVAHPDGSRLAVLSMSGRESIIELWSVAKDASATLTRTVSGLEWDSKLNGWHGDTLVVTFPFPNQGVHAIEASNGMQREINAAGDEGVIYANNLWVPTMIIGNRRGLGSVSLAARPANARQPSGRGIVLDAVPIRARGCYDAARHQAVFFTDSGHYVQIMDLNTGQPVHQYPHRGVGDTCVVSADGRWMATWDREMFVLYDHAQGRAITPAAIKGRPGFAASGNAPHILQFRQESGRKFAFDTSRSGEPALIISDADGDVVHWHWASGNVQVFSAPWNHLRPIPFALRPFSNEIWLGDQAGNLHVFDTNDDAKPSRVIPAAPIAGNIHALAIAFNRDGSRLAAGYFQQLKLIDADSGADVRLLADDRAGDLRGLYANGLDFFAGDGKLLMHGVDTFSVWDIGEGGAVTEPLPRGGGLSTPLIGGHPERPLVVASSASAGARLWDANAKRGIGEVLGGGAPGNFLSVTAEGYFAGAGADVKRVAFRDGRNVIAAEDAFEAFYRPDIVEDVFSGKNAGAAKLNAAQTLAEALREPAPAAHLELAKLPAAASMRLTLQGRLHDMGGGIGEIRLFRNGKLIRRWNPAARDDTPPDAAVRATPQAVRGLLAAANPSLGNPRTEPMRAADTWPADGKIETPRYAGEAAYTLIAFNRRGTLQSLPGAAHQSAGGPPPRKPRAVIVAVGINDYRARDAALKFAERDAADAVRAFTQALQSQVQDTSALTAKAASPHVEIITLLSKAATRDNLLRRLATLEKQLLPQDKLILFFAGHGVMTARGYTLLTHDYNGKLTSHSTITGQELTDALARIPAESQLLVLDTCHAGGMDSLLRGLYDARASTLAARTGVRLLASASSLQEAIDGYKGNGLFTHVLLDALRNRETDLNEDGVITMGELGQRLRYRVPHIARTVGHRQEPALFLGDMREPVRTLPQKTATGQSVKRDTARQWQP